MNMNLLQYLFVVGLAGLFCNYGLAQSSDELRANIEKHIQIAKDQTSTIYATKRITLNISLPKRNIENTDTFEYKVLYDRSHSLLEGQPIKKGRNDPNIYIFMSNEKYSAHITANANKNGRYVLDKTIMSSNAKIIPAIAPISDWAFQAIYPQYHFENMQVSDFLNNPNTTIKDIVLSEHNSRELWEVSFTYFKAQASKITENKLKGVLRFDPDRSWCLDSFNVDYYLDKSPRPTTTCSMQYTFQDNDTQLSMILNEHGVHNYSDESINGAGSNVRNVEYEMIIDKDCPVARFTLSYYNIPEPTGVTWDKPTPNWVWALLSVGVLALLAILFTWLNRRAARRNAAASTPLPPAPTS